MQISPRMHYILSNNGLWQSDTVISSMCDVQCFCHQLAVPTFSSASTSVSDSLRFPECLSTAPREWAWTCSFLSKVGVHRHANSFKVWSFSCRVIRIYNLCYAPNSNTACPVVALQSGLRRLLWVYRELCPPGLILKLMLNVGVKSCSQKKPLLIFRLIFQMKSVTNNNADNQLIHLSC